MPLIISKDHTAECRKGRAQVKSLQKLKGQLKGQLEGKLEGPFISRSWKTAAAEWAKFCAPVHTPSPLIYSNLFCNLIAIVY